MKAYWQGENLVIGPQGSMSSLLSLSIVPVRISAIDLQPLWSYTVEMISVLISKLSSMILITLAGLFAVRAGIFKNDDSKVFSRMVISILQPCMIVNAFQIDLTPERIHGFIAAEIFCFAVFIFWILLSVLFRKLFNLNKVEEMTLIFSNVGNLILPLVQMVLGDEMVFYASAIQLPFNLFLWTYCVMVISGQKKMEFRKVFLNSNVLAVFIGLLFMITGVHFPEVIDTAVTSVSSMVGPLSMFVIGMIIGQGNIRRILTFKKGYLIAFLRLLFYPLSVMGILYVSGILKIFPAYIPVFQVVFFALSAPPAAMVSQLALIYDEEPVEAGYLNVIGTILCAVTIPAVLYIYELLF